MCTIPYVRHFKQSKEGKIIFDWNFNWSAFRQSLAVEDNNLNLVLQQSVLYRVQCHGVVHTLLTSGVGLGNCFDTVVIHSECFKIFVLIIKFASHVIYSKEKSYLKYIANF